MTELLGLQVMTKIAKVYDGVIVAGEVGTAEITATTSNGKTAKVYCNSNRR